jgi:hypothetical protein
MPANPSPLSASEVDGEASVTSTSTSTDPRSGGAAWCRATFRVELPAELNGFRRCETTWKLDGVGGRRRGRPGDANVVERLPSEAMRRLTGVIATLSTIDAIPIRHTPVLARVTCG